MRRFRRALLAIALQCLSALVFSSFVSAQATSLTGSVRDETGGVLPGVEVRVQVGGAEPIVAVTDGAGTFSIANLPSGRAVVSFLLPNFAIQRREVDLGAGGTARVDAMLQYVLSADVTVAGSRTFVNLADVANPAENLVGIAQSASQGAVTARQLESRPLMRTGEVLETVPGLIVSQHSGEGKANQYYLRGFNLDHGTDFATTIAGMPANMPTHAHGHGYTDINFMIPELISGVQYSKGPYFAEQGDFVTAGSANINYMNQLNQPLVRLTGGMYGYGRGLVAASRNVGSGVLLAAGEVETNDGPWLVPGDYQKVNVIGRYSQGTPTSGFNVTGMFYNGTWNSTDQIPARALDEGLDRFGTIDPTDGGDTTRYSGSFEWQRTGSGGVTRVSAYGIGYSLDLFSNFTYFLDDPDNGDQFKQADRRGVFGGRVIHRRLDTWGGRQVQNAFGAQVRADNISVALTHTKARELLHPVREDDVFQVSTAVHAQNEIAWSPWLRTLAGLRADVYRFDVDAITEPLNSGDDVAGIVSPKGGVVVGPFAGTEFYGNFGLGFHSNDARGSTITVDPQTGEPVDRVTPLARARGSEFGVRTVKIPHLQSSLSVWSLNLASELIFIGDAGTTEAGRPSHRWGFEFANYYRPVSWVTIDADVAWSSARFTDDDPAGDQIPGSLETVMSGGISMEGRSPFYGGARLRYFGPRPLVEDGSVKSDATSLVNAEAGYRFTPRLRLAADLLNLFDAKASDIDYYYASRLSFESDAVDDRHFHPTIPRSLRIALTVQF